MVRMVYIVLASRLGRLSRYSSALFVCVLLVLATASAPGSAGESDVVQAPPSVGEDVTKAAVTSMPRTHADVLARQPRFIHTVSDECTLLCVAERLEVPVTRLLTYNADLNESAGGIISAGTQLVVPIAFPLLPGMEPLKADVLQHRFVAAYRIAVPFARVGELTEWYRERLPAYGYELIDDRNGGSLRFAGGWIARGTVEFSPGDEDHPMLIDVALVVGDGFAGVVADEGDE